MWFACCKLESRKQCGTNNYSCRKNGLSCVSACKGCHKVGCYNSSGIPEDNDVDDNLGLADRNIFEIFFSVIIFVANSCMKKYVKEQNLLHCFKGGRS